MRIVFNFCKHAMGARIAELLEEELSCLIEGKKRGKHKTKLLIIN